MKRWPLLFTPLLLAWVRPCSAEVHPIVPAMIGLESIVFADDSGGTYGSQSLGLGFAADRFRFGAQARIGPSHPRRWLLETGGFLSFDWVHVVMGDQYSVGVLTTSIQPMARFELERPSNPALTVPLLVGMRALGVIVEWGGGPVFEFPVGTSGTDVGWTMEARLGLELVEFISFAKSL
ncbi:MAG TPA: hypothetical protein VLC09_02805 [Polyangiaceae bacterium]|nr:hypothetical protein [Polyangiaceae bacterium]